MNQIDVIKIITNIKFKFYVGKGSEGSDCTYIDTIYPFVQFAQKTALKFAFFLLAF